MLTLYTHFKLLYYFQSYLNAMSLMSNSLELKLFHSKNDDSIFQISCILYYHFCYSKVETTTYSLLYYNRSKSIWTKLVPSVHFRTNPECKEIILHNQLIALVFLLNQILSHWLKPRMEKSKLKDKSTLRFSI